MAISVVDQIRDRISQRKDPLAIAERVVGRLKKPVITSHLAPTLDELGRDGAPMEPILSGPIEEGIRAAYYENDTEAVYYQKRYKKLARRAILAWALIAINGSIFALWQPSDGRLYMLMGLQGLCMFAAYYFARRVSDGDLYKKWMEARAAAERMRMEFFTYVTGRPDGPLGGEEDKALLALQFAYFKRHLLQDQMGFFFKRSQQHDSNARSFLEIGSVLGGIGAIAFSSTGILETWLKGPDGELLFDPNKIYYAAMIVPPILLGALNSVRLLSHDQQKALLYQGLYQTLKGLSEKRLPIVAEAVHRGERAPFERFVEDVMLHLIAEHGEWLRLQKTAGNPDFDQIQENIVSKIVGVLTGARKAANQGEKLGKFDAGFTPKNKLIKDVFSLGRR
jgi:hypothetical protein